MRASSHKIALFCTVAILSVGNTTAQAGEIDIPASDMRKALDTYIRVSGLQIAYASNDIVGLTSNPVHGQYSPGAALDIMLKGTQLSANWDGSSAAVISKQVTQVPADIGGGSAATPETVVVTGSRVISDIANSPTPVTEISATQLIATSPTNLNMALKDLPVFMGSTGGQGRTQGASNGVADNLNLRNFGTNRNLVLFDSHRVVNTQSNGAVNVDILPEMLIQRIDVVTGGASAVYGSDAVTGVVNYILDKNFNGIKYLANAGTSQSTYGTQFQVGVAAGSDLFGGRGHLEGTVRYQHIDSIPTTDLPYAKDGNAWAYAGAGTAAEPYFIVQNARRNDDPFGGLIGCGTCSVNGQTFVQNGIIGPYDAGKVQPGSGPTSTLSVGGTGRRDLFADFNAMQHTMEAFGRFSYDVNDNTVASVQVRATEAGYWNIGPNNGLPPGSGAAARPNTFAVTNPYLTAAAQAALASGNPGCPGGLPTAISVAPGCVFSFVNYMGTLDGVTLNSAGASGQMNTTVKNGLPTFNYGVIDREMAATFDLTGELSGRWDWDLYFTHDESREKNNSPVNQNFQDTYAAEDAVLVNGKPACYVSTTQYASLYPNCDPLNPFGPNSLTATQYASFTHATEYKMTNTMDDLGASIAGTIFTLPAGPVKAALSGEARWLGYVVNSNAEPGTVDCTGLRLCSTATPLWYQTTLASISPKSELVYEFGGEANIPLLSDLPLVQDLSLNVAGRYTDYSVSGSVETWKVGFDYHVVDDLKFRGTMSVDIRAPTLNDLYQPFAIGNSSLNDILTGKSADLSAYSGGNTNLKPEVGHTYTVGAVLTPRWIPNFTASVDYYRINLYGAITALTYTTTAVQKICIQSGGTSAYCSLAQRPNPITDTSPANFPTSITNKSLNSATQKTEGVDFEMDYNFDLNDAIGVPGLVTMRNLYSYQPYITNVAFPGSLPSWTSMPKSRDTLFLGYTQGSWGFNLRDHWLGGFDHDTTKGQVFLTRQDRHTPSYNQVDITIDKKYAVGSSVADFYLSVNDVTDALYPVSMSSLTIGASNPGFYYPVPNWGYSLGRYFTIGVRGNL